MSAGSGLVEGIVEDVSSPGSVEGAVSVVFELCSGTAGAVSVGVVLFSEAAGVVSVVAEFFVVVLVVAAPGAASVVVVSVVVDVLSVALSGSVDVSGVPPSAFSLFIVIVRDGLPVREESVP